MSTASSLSLGAELLEFSFFDGQVFGHAFTLALGDIDSVSSRWEIDLDTWELTDLSLVAGSVTRIPTSTTNVSVAFLSSTSWQLFNVSNLLECGGLQSSSAGAFGGNGPTFTPIHASEPGTLALLWGSPLSVLCGDGGNKRNTLQSNSSPTVSAIFLPEI